MRNDLRRIGKDLLTHYKEIAFSGEHPITPDYFRHVVADLAIATATLRTPVARDRDRKVLYMPQAEIGTRLGKQFLKLAQAGALLYHRRQTGDAEYELLLRVAVDTIPTRRAAVLRALLNGNTHQSAIVGYTGLPASSVKIELEDLKMLGAVTESLTNTTADPGEGSRGWSIEPSFEGKLNEIGLRERLTRNFTPVSA